MADILLYIFMGITIIIVGIFMIKERVKEK